MARGAEVLEMLIPQGGWVITADEFESIQFLECDPISKEQYLSGFKEYDKFKAAKEKAKAEEKSALLGRLGITADEAKLLLS